MNLNKTTFYLTDEIKELLRKTSYLSRRTKTEIVNEALKIGLNNIINKYGN